MSLGSLFPGMEAYLDGDVEINNNISTPEDDEAMADQSAEIASDLADAQNDDKDIEIATTMMLRAHKLYTHVKTYGIDRTFLSIYNSNGELNKVCGIRFPSCESMPVTGNPHSQYSARFIAAMEAEGETWWQFIKRKAREIWEWIKEKANKIWTAIKGFFDFLTRRWHRIADYFKKNKNAGANDPDAKDCADDAKTAADQMRETKENNDKAAETASKAGEEVIKSAKKAAAAENGSEEQKSAVEETVAKAEELNKQVQKIEAQAEQQKRDQEDLSKRMAESTARNNKRGEEERKKKEDPAMQQERSEALAKGVLDYLHARVNILDNPEYKTFGYNDLTAALSSMVSMIDHFKNIELTEDGKKIAAVLLQAAEQLRNVKSLIFNSIYQCGRVDEKIMARVEKILRTDERITKFTTTAKEVLRNSKEPVIVSAVNTYKERDKDKNRFDRLLQ